MLVLSHVSENLRCSPLGASETTVTFPADLPSLLYLCSKYLFPESNDSAESGIGVWLSWVILLFQMALMAVTARHIQLTNGQVCLVHLGVMLKQGWLAGGFRWPGELKPLHVAVWPGSHRVVRLHMCCLRAAPLSVPANQVEACVAVYHLVSDVRWCPFRQFL